jgi:hypothetical protein
MAIATRPRREFLCTTLGWAACAGMTQVSQAWALPAQEAKQVSPAIAMLPTMALAQTSAGSIVGVGARGTVLFADPKQTAVPVPSASARLPMPPPPPGGLNLPPPINWQSYTTPVNATLTSLCFVSATRGYTVGHVASVYRTDDTGKSWQAISPTPATLGGAAVPFFDVAASSEDDLIVVGAFGKAVRSRDGGKTWQAINLPNPKGLHLYGVANSGDMWVIVGEQGFLIQSVDNGQSWSNVLTPLSVTWFGLLLGKDGELTVYGLQGTILHRNVGANSFSQVSTPNKSTVSAAARLKDGSVVFAMQTGQLIRWRNGNPIAQILPFVSPFPAIAMLSVSDGQAESLWVAGLRGTLRFPLRA